MSIELGKDIQLASRITASLLNEALVEVTPLVGKGNDLSLRPLDFPESDLSQKDFESLILQLNSSSSLK